MRDNAYEPPEDTIPRQILRQISLRSAPQIASSSLEVFLHCSQFLGNMLLMLRSRQDLGLARQ